MCMVGDIVLAQRYSTVEGSVSRSGSMEMAPHVSPSVRLVMGPAIETARFVRGLPPSSSSRRETPPRANRVMSVARMPSRRATRTWANS